MKTVFLITDNISLHEAKDYFIMMNPLNIPELLKYSLFFK